MKKGGLKNCTLIVSNDEGEAKKKLALQLHFLGERKLLVVIGHMQPPANPFFPWQSTTIKVQFVVFPRSLRELLLHSRKMCCKILQMAIKKARQAAFLVYFMTAKDNLKTSVHILKYVPKIRQRNVSQYRKFDSMSH